MKRFVLLITALLACNTLKADTITINWGVDNQPYTTTTCEIGGDVILPSVSKRGHIFRGWQAEHFDRGTFADWDMVPTNGMSYNLDIYGNYTPLIGDYIFLENTYDCQSTIVIKQRYDQSNNIPYLDVFYQDYWRTYNMRNYTSSVSRLFIAGNNLSVYMDNNIWNFHFYTETSDLMYKNNNYNTGNNIFNIHYRDGKTTEVFKNCQSIGTWKFVYDGVWKIDGKNGWKPDVQISNE
ncbi:MAG: hypothetical protein IKN73_04610 [Alphaproteobacteria bacterium]|nr:hypothetical protein [Alphaproteobacteria bacterium]